LIGVAIKLLNASNVILIITWYFLTAVNIALLVCVDYIIWFIWLIAYALPDKATTFLTLFVFA
jgi:uncharacterized protein (DUF486 family)